MRDYVRPLWPYLRYGSGLCRPVGSKLGLIIIITFLVIQSVPLITQLDIYHGKISWNIIGINSVFIQESITLTFILEMGKYNSI